MERFAELQVRITVDRDRFDPVFGQLEYFREIPETEPVGYLVLTVEATDGDERQFPVRNFTKQINGVWRIILT